MGNEPVVAVVRGNVLHDLQERIKELTALHSAARVLQDDGRSVTEQLAEIAGLLPAAWQYPEMTCGRIAFDGEVQATPGFVATPWRQRAAFATASGRQGFIEVCYREAAPAAAEGPFLAEERNLIDSLAEMLRSYLERKEARAGLQEAHDELELRVEQRTAELVRVNTALQEEIARSTRSEERIRSLAAELSRAEEAERRAIASDLHDHIGQALATIKIKLVEIQRSAAFSGYERTLEEMRSLLDHTIRTTRTLTVEISPPILYELGLLPALQWLGEQFERKHDFAVTVLADDLEPADEIVQLVAFKAVRELLTNTAKHAHAHRAAIKVRTDPDHLWVSYRDDGGGFDPAAVDDPGLRTDAFGLFNIRERCTYLGGRMRVESAAGQGVRIDLGLPLHVAPPGDHSHDRPHPAGR